MASTMSVLAQVSNAVEAHDRFVERQVARARSEPEFRDQILQRWNAVRASIGIVATPTGLKLPRLALPQTDEPGEIARYLYGEGLPGGFPFANAAYREMDLEVGGSRKAETGKTAPGKRGQTSLVTQPALRKPRSEVPTA